MRTAGERGNAVVGFTLVAPLLLAVALGVLQLALTMHVRTVLVSAASEGARAQARVGAPPGAGEARARQLAARTLAADLVENVTVRRERVGGVLLASVEVRARMPLLGLLAPLEMSVQGHAIEEPM